MQHLRPFSFSRVIASSANVPKPKKPKPKKPPTIATMRRWVENGEAKATDGCTVEPDGSCPHGHKSWLLVLGLI